MDSLYPSKACLLPYMVHCAAVHYLWNLRRILVVDAASFMTTAQDSYLAQKGYAGQSMSGCSFSTRQHVAAGARCHHARVRPAWQHLVLAPPALIQLQCHCLLAHLHIPKHVLTHSACCWCLQQEIGKQPEVTGTLLCNDMRNHMTM